MPPAVLLDSSSDLDLFQAQEIGVDLLLQTVDFAGQVWLEQSEIEAHMLFGSLRSGATRPRFTPVSVEAYSNTLERMLSRASHVFALHSAYDYGNILEVARAAAQRFPGRVTVYSSPELSASMAVQAERAVVWLREGATPGEVMTRLEQLHHQARFSLCLSTTEFFTRFPRSIPSSEQWLRGMLPGALPILGFPDGQIQLVSQATTPPLALSMMRQRMQRKAREVPGGDIVFFHCAAPEQLAIMRDTARQLALHERWSVPLGLVLAAYTGPGAYGFGIFPRAKQ